MANEFKVKNGLIVTGSISVSAGITGSLLGSASYAPSASYAAFTANAITTLPAGTVSSSTQFKTLTDPFTGSFTGSHTGTFPYTGLTGVPSGIISSSAQLPLGIVSTSAQTTAFLPIGIISSSAQLPAGTISSSTQLPLGIVSTSAQVLNGLNTGTISSSTQFKTLTDPFTGSFTGSYTGTFPYTGLTSIPGGIISSSTQLPLGIVSTSAQTTAFLPNGTISSSTQLPLGIVSTSAQIIAPLGGHISSSTQFKTLTDPFSGSFTGSFVGTLAGSVTSASYALSASYAPPQASISASYALSASYAPPQVAVSASYATTASYSVSASWAPGGNIILPNGIISSSTQFKTLTDPFTGSFTGSHTGTFPYSGLTSIPIGIISSSAQLPLGIVSTSAQTTAFLPSGVVSSSTQLPAGTISSSTQLPAGTVSSSIQIIAPLGGFISSSTQFKILTDPFTGSFTGSHTGTFPYTSLTSIPGGIISSSTQLPLGIVSTSAQVKPLLPDGTVSSSAQATTWTVLSASYAPPQVAVSASYALSASYAPPQVSVSASYAVTSSYAESASWAPGGQAPGASFPYIGVAGISGSLLVSGSTVLGNGLSLIDSINPEVLLVSSSGTTVNTVYAYGNVNNYAQVSIKNFSAGNSASSDFVATSNDGTETNNYIDMGINSSGHVNNVPNSVGTGSDGYLYLTSSVGELYVGNASSGAKSNLRLFTGGITADSNTRIFVSASGDIGVGTITPIARFDVSGSVSNTDLIRGASSNNDDTQIVGRNYSTGNSASIAFEVRNSLYDGNTGFVRVGMNGSGFTKVRVNPGSNSDGYLFMTSSVGELHIGHAATTANSNIRLFTGGVSSDILTRVYISSSGFVGIGTTTASALLHVSGTVQAHGYLVNMSGSNTAPIRAVAGSPVSLNLSGSTYFIASSSGAGTVTWSIINANTLNTRAQAFMLRYVGGGNVTNTWFTTTKWSGGAAPTLSTGAGMDLLGFVSDDGGASWRGALLQRNSL
jgi:hypothetical protein